MKISKSIDQERELSLKNIGILLEHKFLTVKLTVIMTS